MTTETTPPTRSGFNHIVAFEVAKAELVVHCLPAGTSTRLANTPTAIRRLLKGEARRNGKHRLGNLLVVCEATGGYERALIAEAAGLDLPCHRAHGSAVRAYARFSGTHAKSDPRTTRFSGLVNGVLRSLARAKDAELAPALAATSEAPGWFSERLLSAYGAEKAQAILAAHRHEAPVDFTVSIVIAFTVAAVPTGMNAGVRMMPRGSARRPVRAAPSRVPISNVTPSVTSRPPATAARHRRMNRTDTPWRSPRRRGRACARVR